MDYIPDLSREENNDEEDIIKINEEIDKDNNDNIDNNKECEVCYEEINKEDKDINKIPCGHLFCSHCWFNYLKSLITEAKVENIKCMNHECNQNITDGFILNHIQGNKDLIEKYKKFKKRKEIINDKNKKLCPHPNCDSFLEKSNLSKYIKCENGHKYCFDCLKKPHGQKSCDYEQERQFFNWSKSKKLKRCPRCHMFIKKNEGCNHMTCASCQYQWCWLCEGKFEYGHYDFGVCKGLQFAKANNLEEIIKQQKIIESRERESQIVQIGQIDQIPFGIHKIFTCICDPIYDPFELNLDDVKKCWSVIGFWFFGFFIIYFYTIIKFIGSRVHLNNDQSCVSSFFDLIVIAIGIFFPIPYQALFSALLTPFILVCSMKYEFFYKLLMFFGIGNSS